jgi:hypothetical protein
LEADVFDNSHEQVWPFPALDGAQFKDRGQAYFESHARQRAATIGCNLVGMKDIRSEFVRGRWVVTGTAILNEFKAAGCLDMDLRKALRPKDSGEITDKQFTRS